MPIVTRSTSHFGRVGITNFVFVIIMLFNKSVTDKILITRSCRFVLLTQVKPEAHKLSSRKPLYAEGVHAYRWRELKYLRLYGERDWEVSK
jgi:hypothetical protein